MSRRVRIHHFVMANLVRPETNAWRASDLFHVSYWVGVSPDTEFPHTVPRMQLFARFYLDGARPMNFRVRVTWEEHPSGVPELLGDFGPYHEPFTRHPSVHDRSFTLHNLQLHGVGLHTIELLRERSSGWDAGEWIVIKETHFVVER
jgi:hypothetical protein